MKQPTSHDIRMKLDRRIHNQRVALRQNWQIVERRMWELAAYPKRAIYLESILRLHRENAELRKALQAKVTSERGEHYRIVRRVKATNPLARKDPT